MAKSGHIPLNQLNAGDFHNIRRVLNSREGEALVKLLNLTEKRAIEILRDAKDEILYRQSQGVAQLLEELSEIMISPNREL